MTFDKLNYCSVTTCKQLGVIRFYFTVGFEVFPKVVTMGKEPIPNALEGVYCVKHARKKFSQWRNRMFRTLKEYPF